jgi:CO/xanthine dehydrogenase Mo-binding subunit
MTLSPVVLSRGGLHASGPYHCDHVRIRARAAATNHPPHGAFRGFGAPQSVFAIERHLDKVAAQLGIDGAELRRRNFLAPGQTMATGQVVRDEIDLPELLDRALTMSDYARKRTEFARLNAESAARGTPIRQGALDSPASCTGQALPDRASAIWRRWWRSMRHPKGRSGYGRPRPRLAKAKTPSSPRLPRTCSACPVT